MSRKQRLESLAQLGQLTDKDIRNIQHGLSAKQTMANNALAWITIAAFEAIVIAVLLIFILQGGGAWK